MKAVRRLLSRARRFSPLAGIRRVAVHRQRARYETLLAERLPNGSSEPTARGCVLVDGGFDNPNYWFRYSVLRAAGRFAVGSEVGLIGEWRRRAARATFARLGIVDVVDGRVDIASWREPAAALVDATSDAADILGWQLPEEFPGVALYDGLLKRQRTAAVDIRHPLIVDHVAESLAELDAARRLVNSRQWSLFALSHAVNFHYAALAWTAARHGIPVIVCFGNYGTPRYWRINSPADIFDSVDRPKGRDLDTLPGAKAGALAEMGERYLGRRLAGQTDDIGARYAFQYNNQRVDREGLTTALNWPADRPVVTVYASNWFDFPHGCGMSQFADFLDWTQATLAAARQNREVSWLFRAHPCDQWYGGLTLADAMPSDSPSHVRLCPTEWHGADVMMASDAVITVHGTIGIEAAINKRPVLVADVGWYHDCGFVTWPKTREDYLSALTRPWWRDVDLAAAQRRAALFAGMYFGAPSWQPPLISGDDSEQSALYRRLTTLLSEAPQALAREVDTVAAWLASGERFYHTYKMRQADSFTLTNVQN